MEQLYWESWESLSTFEKKNTLSLWIKEHCMPFTIKSTQTFSQNGLKVETLILDLEGTEFVFVPGKRNVTLGWDSSTCKLGERVSEEFVEEFAEEYEYLLGNYEEEQEALQEELNEAIENNDVDRSAELKSEMEDMEHYRPQEKTLEEFIEHIDKNTSPVRTVDICPMIVQRDMEYISENMEYNEFLKTLEGTPFAIPTEDQWEYLCGGGTRTFFRWGDFLKEEIGAIYRHREDDIGKCSLFEPNMFGLYIAYDSYMCELVRSGCRVKGGDGGCTICGGDGVFYTMPIFSTFYVTTVNEREILSKNYYCYRKIICI